MKKELTGAVEKTMKRLEAYKEQAPDRYEQLVGAVKMVERVATDNLPQDPESKAGLKATGVTTAKALLTYILHTGQLETVGNAKQIVALIQEELQ